MESLQGLPAPEMKGETKNETDHQSHYRMLHYYDSRISDHPQTCIFGPVHRLPHAGSTRVA